MPIDKLVGSFDEAVKDVFDGALILVGGFGNPGSCPSYLIRSLAKQGAKQLTIVGNTTGITSKEMMEKMAALGVSLFPDWFVDVDILCQNRQVKKAIAAFPIPTSALLVSTFERQLRAGQVEIEMVPQGTLAEKIRANKAGIGGFLYPNRSRHNHRGREGSSDYRR